jgi:hypothetical protein
VLRKEYVAISAPAGQGALEVKAVPTSTVPADKPGKAKTAQSATAPPASPQKVVRNIDGALAPAVLSYLQHNGFLGSAAAMRKDMNSRKRLLETGLGQGDESRSAKVAKTDKWYEAQEDSWRCIHKIKADYAANRLSSVWHQLREGTGPSIGFPRFLESDDGLWACRLRIRYFYKVLWKYLGQEKERDIASSEVGKKSLCEDLADADFKTFLFGATSPSPEASHESPAEGDASNVLLALGNHLRVEHGSSPNSVIKHASETALSYMSYNHLSELPRDVYSDMSQDGLAREAAELVKAIRGEHACPAMHITQQRLMHPTQIIKASPPAVPSKRHSVPQIVRCRIWEDYTTWLQLVSSASKELRRREVRCDGTRDVLFAGVFRLFQFLYRSSALGRLSVALGIGIMHIRHRLCKTSCRARSFRCGQQPASSDCISQLCSVSQLISLCGGERQ